MAAAIPMSTPRGHRGRTTSTSSATNAISSRLTCPNSIVCITGSSANAGIGGAGRLKSIALPGCTSSARGSAIEATDSAPPRPPEGHSRRATTKNVSPSAAVDSASSTDQASTQGATASGRSTIAAKGG